MDIMELGAFGELVGGVAVLVTLIYLAIQVRQSAQAQQQANDLAKADALQRSVSIYSTTRQLLMDEGVSAILLKALHDEDLTPNEGQRLYTLLQEITYSSLAALQNFRSVADDSQVDGIPTYVAQFVGRSETLKRTWASLAEELEVVGYGEFAQAIVARLGALQDRTI